MRDPRNWARPAAALLAGTAAGTALVVLRARRRAAGDAAAERRRHAQGRGAHARRHRARDPQAARRALSPPSARRAPASAAERPLKRPAGPGPARLSLRNGHLLPPPLARDRRLVLELRAPDLPRLHDEHAGRDALPRVLAPAHEGQAAARHRDGPARHLRADRDQRDRLPDRAGAADAVRHGHPRQGDRRRRALPRSDRRRPRLLPPRLRRLPAREPAAHRLQHVPALHPRADARAGDRGRALRGDLLHLPAGRLLRRAARDRPPRASAPPARSSA